MTQTICGFEPIASANAKLLILGSIPSIASLDEQQYYAKPQNAFWKIMGDLFAAGTDQTYQDRVARLQAKGVAVWDVIACCVRPGSLDSAIDMNSVETNDLRGFFHEHAHITHVFFNGRKAEEIYRRRLMTDIEKAFPGMVYTALPSTSPAMASLNYAAKLARWQVLTQI